MCASCIWQSRLRASYVRKKIFCLSGKKPASRLTLQFDAFWVALDNPLPPCAMNLILWEERHVGTELRRHSVEASESSQVRSPVEKKYCIKAQCASPYTPRPSSSPPQEDGHIFFFNFYKLFFSVPAATSNAVCGLRSLSLCQNVVLLCLKPQFSRTNMKENNNNNSKNEK